MSGTTLDIDRILNPRRLTNSPQLAAYNNIFREDRDIAVSLDGGAGLGGKSFTTRVKHMGYHLFLHKIGVKGAVTQIICRRHTDLVDRFVSKLEQEWGPSGDYANLGQVKANGKHGHAFYFHDKTMGAIKLRHIGDNPDKFRGTENTGTSFDECTEAPGMLGARTILNALIYPIRSVLHVPKFLSLACNPDGIGFWWVYRAFIERDPDTGELTDTQGLDPKVYGMDYFPYTVYDNPSAEAAAEAIRKLESEPNEHIRNGRLYGIWSFPEGARFIIDKKTHIFNFKKQFPHGIPTHWPVLVTVDWGYSVPCALLWHCFDENGDIYTFREVYKKRLTTEQQAQRIINLTAPNERIFQVRADPTMWNRESTAETGTLSRMQITNFIEIMGKDHRFGPVLPGPGGKGYRQAGFSTLENLLARGNGYPNWYIASDCQMLLAELQGAVEDTEHPERNDLHPDCADHAITSCVYGFSGLAITKAKSTTTSETGGLVRTNAELREAEIKARLKSSVKRRGI